MLWKVRLIPEPMSSPLEMPTTKTFSARESGQSPGGERVASWCYQRTSPAGNKKKLSVPISWETSNKSGQAFRGLVFFRSAGFWTVRSSLAILGSLMAYTGD
ncbi:MAG: hypothetical protein M2R46_04019 [Verrucomicrobia subdivision 3 bacterium]|nr:hypothetical protein [Limisphaerales bacterium]